jgi:hypothetical protein
MKGKVGAAVRLIDSLARAWDSGTAENLVELWAAHLGAATQELEVGGGHRIFLSSIKEIYFRGAAEIPCVLVGGHPEEIRALLRSFQSLVADPARFFIVLAVSERAATEARATLSGSRFVLFGPRALEELLTAVEPIAILRKAIRTSIPVRSLNPYNILLTPEENMFFGREAQLQLLHDDDSTSFAIAGPSRIGKSSLAHKYLRDLRRKNHRRAQSSFYVDLMECPSRSPGAQAQFVAMRLDGSRVNTTVRLDEFSNLLRRMRNRLGVRVELVLDEVDSSVDGQFFQVLGDAAKQNLCRLLLCGRGGLLRSVLRSSQYYGSRLDLIRLDPLDDISAETLVLRPLRDLGFEIESEPEVLSQLFELTGKLPHLLQFCLRRLVEAGISYKRNTITAEDIRMLHQDYDTVQYFTSPLSDLMSPVSRLVALTLLNMAPDQVNQSTVQQIAAVEGLKLGLDQCKEICNDLFINNILAWHAGSYRVVNKAITQFTRENGYLQDAISEAKGAISQNPPWRASDR